MIRNIKDVEVNSVETYGQVYQFLLYGWSISKVMIVERNGILLSNARGMWQSLAMLTFQWQLEACEMTGATRNKSTHLSLYWSPLSIARSSLKRDSGRGHP